MAETVRSAARQLAFGILGSRPIVAAKIRAIHSAQAVTILNLHRVGPPDRSTYPPLSPAMFDELLKFVRRNFEVVTFAQLKDDVPGDRPRLILSFDDGYADFAQYAAPLLEKHGLRANQNIIPECVETGSPPLNVLMQDYVGRASDEELAGLQVPGFDFDPARMPRPLFGMRLSRFIKSRPIAEQRALGDELLPQVRRKQGFKPTAMMTLDQVRRVAETHEIGAHSFSHASLGVEDHEFAREDVRRCKRWFADSLSSAVDIYAFPNGSYRPEQIDMVRSEGVKHVLLVDGGFSAPGHLIHKRFNFCADSRAEMRFRATGAFRWPHAQP